jgi:hypothetical protein
MWQVEYPGRNKTTVCPGGPTGIISAQASQPAAATAAIKISQTSFRTISTV